MERAAEQKTRNPPLLVMRYRGSTDEWGFGTVAREYRVLEDADEVVEKLRIQQTSDLGIGCLVG